MCGDCYSMTPKEAENYYAMLRIGRADKRVHASMTRAEPRQSIRARLQVELAMGEYDDMPRFRNDLQDLVDMNHTDMRLVEIGVIGLRKKHGRTMLTDIQVDSLWARRDELRRLHEAGLPAPKDAPVRKGIVKRVMERLGA